MRREGLRRPGFVLPLQCLFKKRNTKAEEDLVVLKTLAKLIFGGAALAAAIGHFDQGGLRRFEGTCKPAKPAF